MKRNVTKIVVMTFFKTVCMVIAAGAFLLMSAKDVYAAAPANVVDLIIFAGQSNMSGNGGDASKAPKVPTGHGYEYRAVTAPNTLMPLAEPFGRGEKGYICDFEQYQNGTLVSSFVNAYYDATGVPVIAVPCTRGGTDSAFWANSAASSEVLSRFTKAKSYLEKNGFTIRRKYLVFLQGESDSVAGTPAYQYRMNLVTAFQPLFANGLEQVFLITPGYAANGMFNYDDIVKAQLDLCEQSPLFSLGSAVLHTLPTTYLKDAVHYNQEALNLAGQSAGLNAAVFTNGGMK